MNRLVLLCYNIDPATYPVYEQMLYVAVDSYERHLAGDWDLVVLEGGDGRAEPKGAIAAMWQDLHRYLDDAHAAGHTCVSVDTDTVCVKPVDLFGEFGAGPAMRLFWPTDPWSGFGFDPYLNAGVMVLPASMPRSLWDLVRPRVEHIWEWPDSQNIWNTMYYAQGLELDLRPELLWMPAVDSPIPRDEARILHLNSTRGAEDALAAMRSALERTA